MTISVLLADDHHLIRHGFSVILGAQEEFTVVGEAADGGEAVSLATALRPDVVLMDVRMPVLDGIGATRQITALGLPTRILILTTFDLDEYALEGLRAGASGFLLKNARPEELLAGIRSVAAGDAVLAPTATRRLLEKYLDEPGVGVIPGDGRSALGLLTTRELEVFNEMAAGLTNREIAGRLYLSEATVKTHVVHVLSKLGLRDRVQAVIFAYENGVSRTHRAIPPPTETTGRGSMT